MLFLFFLWDFFPMGFPCYFYDLSKGVRFLWDFHVISIVSMIFLWDFCEILMEFPCYFYDLSMGFL